MKENLPPSELPKSHLQIIINPCTKCFLSTKSLPECFTRYLLQSPRHSMITGSLISLLYRWGNLVINRQAACPRAYSLYLAKPNLQTEILLAVHLLCLVFQKSTPADRWPLLLNSWTKVSATLIPSLSGRSWEGIVTCVRSSGPWWPGSFTSFFHS